MVRAKNILKEKVFIQPLQLYYDGRFHFPRSTVILSTVSELIVHKNTNVHCKNSHNY